MKVKEWRLHMVRLHSASKEIPSIRFAKARQAGNTVFRPFTLPEPYTSPKDVFSLRETRVVHAYRRVSLFSCTIEVSKVPLGEHFGIHMIPDTDPQMMEPRIWWKQSMVHSVCLALHGFRVHL